MGKRGFTLIEMLVVIAILGVLIAIMIPVISSMRRSARVTQCASNLRQIGQSLFAYRSEHRVFPHASMMPAPFFHAIPDDPATPPLQEALSAYLSRRNSVYRCPSDLTDVYDRVARANNQVGLSYFNWIPLPWKVRYPNPPLLNDYQGTSKYKPDPAQFHPPKTGMNSLHLDGSVQFGRAGK